MIKIPTRCRDYSNPKGDYEMSDKFILEIKGAGFTLTMQGNGDMDKAAEAASKAFGDMPVSARSFGEDMDMSGQ